jgi:transitional endoplasmic reticulum ATPase
MSKLVLINEGAGGVEIALKPGATTLGRSETNSVAIDDEMISDHHCELRLNGAEVRVRDLQSTNGTFIDEKRITEEILQPGQVLRIGSALFRLETEAVAANVASPAAGVVRLEKIQKFALEQNRLPWLVRVATGVLAGLIVLFVTKSLPLYSADWRVLTFLLVTALWIFRPTLGKLTALAVCFLPIAYYAPALLAVVGVALLAFQPAFAFLVLGSLGVVLVEPGLLCLIPIVPLTAGFLGIRVGPVAAATGCLMAQIMLRLGLSGAQPGVVATAPALSGLLTLQSPVFKDKDWPLSPAGWAEAVFHPFLQQPSLLGEVMIWAVAAGITGWLLKHPFTSRLPARLAAVAGGILMLLIGNLILAFGFANSGLNAGASLFSVFASGALVALVSPVIEPVVQILGKKSDSRTGLLTVGGPGGAGAPVSPKDVPPDEWDDLAGMDDIRAEVQEALQTQFDPEVKASLERLKLQPVRGILLFGPPGTGKTKLARIIAHEAGASFFAVSGTEFTSKFFGESEANLRRIFETAGEHRPAVLFFDELEAFLPKRAEMAFSDSAQRGIVGTFLSYTDGVAALEGVLLVGATNYPDLIDPAALRPGRFDKLIYVSAPDAAARRAIFTTYLRGKALAPDVDLAKLAERTERFTGADIQGVCKEASLTALRAGDQSVLRLADFETIISGVKPSVTFQMERDYQKIADQFCRRSRKPERVEVVARKAVAWDDVVGLDDAKNALREAIEMPLTHAEVLQQYGVKPSKGVLLYGPPGCGKTLLGKVVARQAKAHFLHVKGPELLRERSGESEAKLRELFDRARENTPCVLFFDEIDALTGARGTSDATGTGILNQFLAEMDGVDELKGVVVLGATNRPDAIDPALRRPGRFDRLVYVPPPDAAARAALFAAELRGKPLSPDLDFTALASLTDGYSSADIASLCNAAAVQAAKETIRTGVRQPISTQWLQPLIARTPASIKPEDLTVYENFRGR